MGVLPIFKRKYHWTSIFKRTEEDMNSLEIECFKAGGYNREDSTLAVAGRDILSGLICLRLSFRSDSIV